MTCDNIITAINNVITEIMLHDNRPLGLSKGFPHASLLSFSIHALGQIAPTLEEKEAQRGCGLT